MKGSSNDGGGISLKEYLSKSHVMPKYPAVLDGTSKMKFEDKELDSPCTDLW